jgi:micrococcal nuclease
VKLDGGRQERVRLIGVDAPELEQKPWGERARRFTRTMALRRRAVIEPGAEPRDKHGRLLAYVFVQGRMVNEELLRNGLAVLFTIPPNSRYAERLAAGEQAARAAGIGIWDPRNGLKELPGERRRKKTSSGAALFHHRVSMEIL